ncbi:hypothetical protein TNCT_504231 [Trichonephila clavata]|uniref:Uncharacterized protein n=1 Tax=Trichonephila clavata TaxID=2740835 RepID=A0A8X6FXU0_TRICU|nr:hypothetical protein TNCT_504231 [Trichonephila clavata]
MVPRIDGQTINISYFSSYKIRNSTIEIYLDDLTEAEAKPIEITKARILQRSHTIVYKTRLKSWEGMGKGFLKSSFQRSMSFNLRFQRSNAILKNPHRELPGVLKSSPGLISLFLK